MKIMIAVCVFLSAQMVFAENSQTDFDFHDLNLPDCIRVLAKSARMNVMLDPAVKGVVTMQIHAASIEQALDALLMAKGLSRARMGSVWLIAPRDVLDANMPLETQTLKIRYARAQDIASVLQGGQADFISKRGMLRVDARTNTLFVRDLSANVAAIRRVVLDLDAPIKQILIDVRIASVDQDYERALGIDYVVTSGAQVSPREVGRYSIALAHLADGSRLDVKLAALEMAGHAHLISSPCLFTANQQPASIEAGEEIPYQELSEGGGTAVVFKKAVLALRVTPQVLPEDRVALQMQINQDRPSDKLVQGVPTISTKQMTTNVLVKNGETVVLGGIYEMNEENGSRGLPFLSRIPLLGLLFQESQSRRSKRELLIFVTPKVVA